MTGQEPVLRAELRDGRWRLAGTADGELINGYLGYLADRGFSAQTVRGYAFDLLAFDRWLAAEGITLAGVSTDVMLRFLSWCRTAPLPGRPGGNVYSIRDGRSTGYAPATINRRLAAVSGLFGYWAMRDPAAPDPLPRGAAARRAAGGERGGLLAHLGKPKRRSGLRVREPRRLPRGLDRAETAALLGSFRTDRDRAIAGLMLFCGLRSAEVLGLAVADVDIPRGWIRVMGKGGKERRVPLDPDVAGLILQQ
jgi:site-specific recombinase XerD